MYFTVAGLGVGTSMADMEDMYSQTRYVSNLSTDLGGTGLTALYTGLGKMSTFRHIGYFANSL